jgi:hypothetical protein
MSFIEISMLVVFVALGWLWLDSLKAREIAVIAARNACAGDGYLLLDDTVAIAALKPVRNAEGRLLLQRSYDFEYSDTGDNRIAGGIVLLGHRVILLNIASREGGNVYTLH